MKYFWETVGSIEEGVGFSHFDTCHIIWLIAFVCVTVGVSILYKKSNERNRKIIRFVVAGLIVLDELAKMTMLLVTGLWTVNYLPFHLCTINIFLIVFHTFKSTKTLDNFLYAACIPAAIAALLFPTWTELPPANMMHIHSFSVHILLALYPIMLTVGGDIHPHARHIWKCIALLLALAVPVYFINISLDTNYMFLIEAEAGNPLLIFEKYLGNHLLGYPIIFAVVLLVMYLPPHLKRKIKSKS